MLLAASEGPGGSWHRTKVDREMLKIDKLRHPVLNEMSPIAEDRVDLVSGQD